MNETNKAAYKNPFLWVPSSYLAMGLIYVTVGSMANIMFSNMGMDNASAAFWSSILGFPYTFKFLWAPLLELYKTKKYFVVLMQILIGAAIIGAALSLSLPDKTSTSFSVQDINDLASFAKKLSPTSNGIKSIEIESKESNPDKNKPDLVSIWLFQQLSQNTQEALVKYENSKNESSENIKQLKELLVTDLNKLIAHDQVYDKERFINVELRPETRKLMEKKPQGEELAGLNRLLLEDAYQQEFARNLTWLWPVIFFLAISAILGATQDIGSDGVYVTTLNPTDQAKYTGFQSMCWNVGSLLAQGPMISISGFLHNSTQSWAVAWMTIMISISALMLFAGFHHIRVLPPGSKSLDAPKSFGEAMGTFGHAFVTFLQKKDIWLMIAFAFFYRIGFGLIDKMGPLFMKDKIANGGLGLSNETLGMINGTIGIGAFLLGSLIGGWFVSRAGLKKSLIILCLCLNVPNVTFLVLSLLLPTNIYIIGAIVSLEKLSWGIGCVGHMIYMMQQIAPGPYKTAHYTFATALMGACMMLTGAISGYLQTWVGYKWFFIIVLIAAAPSLLVTLLAPFHHPDSTEPVPEIQIVEEAV